MGIQARQVRAPGPSSHLYPITWGLLFPPPLLLRHRGADRGADKGCLKLTSLERSQETPVGGAVARQLQQEGVKAQPPCGFRRKWACSALGPQTHPWEQHKQRLTLPLARVPALLPGEAVCSRGRQGSLPG